MPHAPCPSTWDIAQIELNAYIQQQADAVPPEIEVDFLLSGTMKSLTLANYIDPSSWQLTAEEVAFALSIPVERIIKFTQLPHCISVVWFNDKGKKCSCFHSYRLFTRWQKAAESLVTSCDTQEKMERVAAAIERDLCRYKYRRPEIANGIWSAVLAQQKALSRSSSKGWSTNAVQLSLF